MSYSIAKLKVKKGLPEVHYSLTNNLGITSSYQVTINGIVHSDLADALERLKSHLCLITELINPMLLGGFEGVRSLLNAGELHSHEAFSGYNVTGFSQSGEGVVLVGNRTLSTNKVLNIIAPYTLMNADSDNPYASDLWSDVHDLVDETVLLLNGKMSGEQLDLFAESEAA